MKRPGYIIDRHIEIVQELDFLLDQASTDYNRSEDVVDDFTAYVKDWASKREQVSER